MGILFLNPSSKSFTNSSLSFASNGAQSCFSSSHSSKNYLGKSFLVLHQVAPAQDLVPPRRSSDNLKSKHTSSSFKEVPSTITTSENTTGVLVSYILLNSNI